MISEAPFIRNHDVLLLFYPATTTITSMKPIIAAAATTITTTTVAILSISVKVSVDLLKYFTDLKIILCNEFVKL